MERLSDLFVRRGVPDYIRSDNGSEFTAKKVTEWLDRLNVKTLFIEPGSPWENGYNESFNGTLRYELLDVELFDTLLEAKVLIERWRVQYNTIRPHSSLGYRPPAPEALLMDRLRSDSTEGACPFRLTPRSASARGESRGDGKGGRANKPRILT